MTSLHCLFAREAETAVILRRGPSTQVLLIHWDLTTHRFTPGQWLKGRIYEHKSDLSPDGAKLVYFAAKHHGKMPTWIAVSSPPFLTAHALWTGFGTWNKISLFESNDRLAIDVSLAAEEFVSSLGLQVVAKRSSGRRFFRLDHHEKLLRDGWRVASGDPVYHPKDDMGAVDYRKELDRGTALFMSISDREMVSFIVVDDFNMAIDLRADWADVHGTDVYYSQGGRLFRLPFARQGERLVAGESVELADFSDLTFRAVLAPYRPAVVAR